MVKSVNFALVGMPFHGLESGKGSFFIVLAHVNDIGFLVLVVDLSFLVVIEVLVKDVHAVVLSAVHATSFRKVLLIN